MTIFKLIFGNTATLPPKHLWLFSWHLSSCKLLYPSNFLWFFPLNATFSKQSKTLQDLSVLVGVLIFEIFSFQVPYCFTGKKKPLQNISINKTSSYPCGTRLGVHSQSSASLFFWLFSALQKKFSETFLLCSPLSLSWQQMVWFETDLHCAWRSAWICLAGDRGTISGIWATFDPWPIFILQPHSENWATAPRAINITIAFSLV